ncbi:class I SAM-dependent methyltransferase [Vibrio profundum]|uniref:class I SAM-dependent methyltransferase n=1 Tax=Vibrio profundum TaxID=2910247 RepID=UPI003D0BD7F3
MNYLDLMKAKQVYSEGGNITSFLREQFRESHNTSEIIEIAYDLQSGSYTKHANLYREGSEMFAEGLANKLRPHLNKHKSLMDVGSGELTTLSLMLNHLDSCMSKVYSLDISWSRMYRGLEFFRENTFSKDIKLTPFVADIKQIPLSSKSIDIVTSVHALEPNGSNLPSLLKEMFRVTREKCILFEPSYELNSEDGKRRMDKLGYIKNIEGIVRKLGGNVLDVDLLDYSANRMNPTACYIIEPPNVDIVERHDEITFSVPGTDFLLKKYGSFLASPDTGLLFPKLKGIPILKHDSAILATSFFDE